MNLTELLEYTFLAGGFTTRCDTARENAETVALAAQEGLLTTATPRDGYMNVWRLTGDGFRHVWHHAAGELRATEQENAAIWQPQTLDS
jgi:hypothetical protein